MRINQRESSGQRWRNWAREGPTLWERERELKGTPSQNHLLCSPPAPMCCSLNGGFPGRLHHPVGVCGGVCICAGYPALETEAWCVCAPLPPPFAPPSFQLFSSTHTLLLSLLPSASTRRRFSEMRVCGITHADMGAFGPFEISRYIKHISLTTPED